MFKKVVTLACLAAAVSLSSGTAMAESIEGRLGVTGKLGFVMPADNDAEFISNRTNKTDTGVIGDGGLIYGIDDNWAAQLEIARSSFDSDAGDFDVTNLSAGAQYRFRLTETPQVVPFAGAGLDLIVADYDPYDGTSRDVDTAFGVHLSGGADYFITKDLALAAEARLVLGPEADITRGGTRSGDFDPINFSSTAGIRYFFY